MQAEAVKDADALMQDDREEQLGMWRGTISADRSYSSSPSHSYAPHPPHTYCSEPRGYVRAPTPLVRPASPAHPLAHPSSTGTSAATPPPPLDQGAWHTKQVGIMAGRITHDMCSKHFSHSSTASV